MDFLPKKKFGFGLMRLPHTDPNDAGTIDLEQTKRMVDLFLERGFTYFDTAWMYCNFKSEETVKEVLTSRHPRDQYTLTSKLHCGFFDSPEGRDEILKAQLEKTGAEYFDYYLLHGIDDESREKYEKFECFSWLLEKKEQGLIRHGGFSFHGSPEVLDDLLTRYPEVELVQLQINYLDWDNAFIRAGECYDVCVKHGKKVVVMEPIKGGTLAVLPEEAEGLLREIDPQASMSSWAIRFAASLDNVMMVLSGMSSLEQMEDNTAYMQEFRPITEEENALLRKIAGIIRKNTAIACTGCSYCTGGCPMEIPIPSYFSLYNEDMREVETKGWTVNITYYEQLSERFAKASACVQCGQCEDVCPQHLPIREYLEKVSSHYEG